MLYSDIF